MFLILINVILKFTGKKRSFYPRQDKNDGQPLVLAEDILAQIFDKSDLNTWPKLLISSRKSYSAM